jgi:hypothetical protein
MKEWKGHRALYWEDGSITGLPGPAFIEADVEGEVNENELVRLDSTHEAWVMTLPYGATVWWLITRLGDHTQAGHPWWEWA